ncbi:MAG: hypothetical protein E5Y89_06370 [Mesorhizobium sp.]|uniref:hypothetical protein n=1 Tax=unclassified Mesorhizobium TaxID=325217 RepID=UPI000FCB41BB|nr:MULTISPECIES: hypothetical protein [unclassified Mesorhizobium]RUX38506.1 hypothetical protein EOA33_34430 [Mesorhizobium sp. M4A.F.Ca.ET.050.02.1.1]TIL82150.1 MAG: hypothetical protein E5Y89_06370 [Mesorhizobium sp.]TIU60127.1 MAG: hypothetical protein E5W25_31540 [Mesorhizobium sp.]TIW33658.1 MAG: hypothetical protein E5V62_19485 [Mesorhizobium sp.]TIW47610.1 MAG: hypothetical protein E5V61_07755 [Mesorhizobium sp.]
MLAIFTSDSSICLQPLANDGDGEEKPRIAHASPMETLRMETSRDCSLSLQGSLHPVRLRGDRPDAVF